MADGDDDLPGPDYYEEPIHLPDTLEHRLARAFLDHNHKLAVIIVHELIERAIDQHEAAHHLPSRS